MCVYTYIYIYIQVAAARASRASPRPRGAASPRSTCRPPKGAGRRSRANTLPTAPSTLLHQRAIVHI